MRATVAQLVEQLTRNEQVVRSNRISSSKVKSPKSGFAPDFSGIFVWLGDSLWRGMWALIALISRKVFLKCKSKRTQNWEEAKLLVNGAWDNKTYVLTADDFAGVSFTHGH